MINSVNNKKDHLDEGKLKRYKQLHYWNIIKKNF